jgi:hypothetical protein
MADPVVPTLTAEDRLPDVLEELPASQNIPTLTTEKKALFDSIAQDENAPAEEMGPSSLKTVFAGLLWFGYAVAIVVALILVWSAVNGLLQSLPHGGR